MNDDYNGLIWFWREEFPNDEWAEMSASARQNNGSVLKHVTCICSSLLHNCRSSLLNGLEFDSWLQKITHHH